MLNESLIDVLALEAAHEIDRLYGLDWIGGSVQRTAAVQTLLVDLLVYNSPESMSARAKELLAIVHKSMLENGN